MPSTTDDVAPTMDDMASDLRSEVDSEEVESEETEETEDCEVYSQQTKASMKRRSSVHILPPSTPTRDPCDGVGESAELRQLKEWCDKAAVACAAQLDSVVAAAELDGGNGSVLDAMCK